MTTTIFFVLLCGDSGGFGCYCCFCSFVYLGVRVPTRSLFRVLLPVDLEGRYVPVVSIRNELTTHPRGRLTSYLINGVG